MTPRTELEALEARVAALEAQRAQLSELLRDLAFVLVHAPRIFRQAAQEDLAKLDEMVARARDATKSSPSPNRS